MSNKPVILTGLRANEDLHIGNYFGALLPLIDQVKQNKGKYQINLFVPDLHSITTEIDHKSLQKNVKNNLKIFVAAGLPLDDEDVKLYRQSYVPAHSELTWILDCFSGFGEMSRMTQFKEKGRDIFNQTARKHSGFVDEKKVLKDPQEHINLVVSRANERTTVGLFNYPVLMATDILLYGAEYVPVGDDQTQHLEFTRDIAQRMNKKFGELFVVPKAVKQQHEFFQKDQGLRIKDLMDPSKKMSKSDESGKGVIFLNDKPEAAAKKVMSATTDSLGKIKFDPDNQPGVSNLLLIYGLLCGKSAEEAAQEFAGEAQYGRFKQKVADKLSEFLSEFQSSLTDVNSGQIDKKLTESEAQMNEVANQTLLKVQKAVGLR